MNNISRERVLEICSAAFIDNDNCKFYSVYFSCLDRSLFDWIFTFVFLFVIWIELGWSSCRKDSIGRNAAETYLVDAMPVDDKMKWTHALGMGGKNFFKLRIVNKHIILLSTWLECQSHFTRRRTTCFSTKWSSQREIGMHQSLHNSYYDFSKNVSSLQHLDMPMSVLIKKKRSLEGRERERKKTMKKNKLIWYIKKSEGMMTNMERACSHKWLFSPCQKWMSS